MERVTDWVQAIYNFFVGDLRILIGTLITVLVVGLLVPWFSTFAGVLFVLLIIITLTLSLRHEVMP